MGWELNRLLKTTGISYTPGSPAIPGSAGTTGSPAYSYWVDTIVPGATYGSPLPPSGWDTEITTPLPGGGTQTLRYGGYRYFNGVKAYLSAVIADVEYIYVAESQTVRTEVFVPAVEPVPATAPVPATEAQLIRDYNLGWNAGASGPDTLAVNTVFTWRMSAGNVGSVVGLTLSTAPQDYGYAGMSLSVMAQSGLYQVYRGGIPLGASAPFTNNTRFALSRTNTGDVELYVDGGLVHTEELAADVVVDCSLFSGGDLIWDAQELAVAVAPLNTNLDAVTVSDAQVVASAIAVTRTFGPDTAMGVAGATTVSRAVNGQVSVNGAIYVGVVGSTTRTAAVGVAGAINVSQTFGPDTAKGLVGATTTSDAVVSGDTTTGVGISTSGGSGDPAMLPLAGAGSGPNVAVGWTGNYVGDALRLRPLTVSAAGGLVEPTIGVATLTMVPMDGDAGGVTGGISVSSSCSMLPMRVLASSETEYSQGYLSFPPLIGVGTNISYRAAVALQIIVDYANDNTNPAPTVEDYADAGVTGVDEGNITDVNAAVDAVTGTDVDTPEKIQAIVNTVNAGLVSVSENLSIASETQSLYNLPILERLRDLDTANTFYQPQAEITDVTQITDPLRVVLVLTVAEALEVADPVQVIQVALLLEEAGVADAIELALQALAVVEDALAAGDSVYAAVTRSTLDTVNVADTATALIRFLSQLTEALAIADTAEVGRLVLVELLDSTTVDDTVQLTAQYIQELLSEARIYALLTTNADVAQGWVMNTEEERPVSEYDNFNFTSLAWYQGQLWGTLDDGLYLLDGDDDAGTPIQAEIASLLLDFATSRQKTVRTVYLGYTATGKLVLKVRSVDNGKMTEKWYSAKPRVADAPREGVMQPGRGLRSRYWQFELANVDGADFEIDHLELYPVILSRRV